jgi:hypothetical protein
MLPNSRLISSDNWGHTSLGTGACVDDGTFAYLVNPTAPAPTGRVDFQLYRRALGA